MFSDGSNTPSELVSIAKSKGISAIALTDHNTISGLEQMEKCAKEQGLEVALGSELTCEYFGKEIHMHALFIDLNRTQGIEKFINYIRKIKKERNIELALALRLDGYDVDFYELEKKYGDNINRAHFAKKLVENGDVKTVAEAFETILYEGGKYYKGSARPCALETIESIVNWGFVPVMAHPLLSLTQKELEEFLPLAKQKGLEGIEVFYPKFSSEQMQILNEMCTRFDLIPSGGSDFHGDIKKESQMGDANVPYSCYERLAKARSRKIYC